MIDYYAELVAAYPLVSIEDPMSEDDWDGWKAITDRLGEGPTRRRRPVRHQPRALQRGIEEGTANALLVKVNQIGSLTETSTRSTWPTATATAA
jgi:enolase